MRMSLKAQDVKRLSRILTVAAKHGFGFVIAEIGLERFVPRAYRRIEKVFGVRTELPRHFREMLQELGPTFIKLGQVLSVRPDLLPFEYINELEKLQDKVPPFSEEEAKNIIRKELGKKESSKILETLSQESIASASLSQVNLAEIDGNKVAVKIQRPDAGKIIEQDLRIMKFVAEKSAERFKNIDTIGLWEEFAASIRNELDFTSEAGNIDEFEVFYREDPIIRIPKVYWDYTTDKIITLEYIEGYKLSETRNLEPENIDADLEKLAEYGARSFMRQVLELGLFHADLHPANIMITPEGEIAYLDFGMVGRIGEEEKRAVALMLVGIIRKDVDEIVYQAECLGAEIPRSKIPSMRSELRRILEKYYSKSLGEYHIDIIGREFISLLHRNGVRIPKNYALLAKALITIEGVGKMMYPDLNVLEVAKPYIEDLVKEHYATGDVIKEITGLLKEDFYIMLKAPRKLDNLFNILQGSSEQRAEQTEAIEKLSRTIKDSTFTIAFSIISAFIAVGLAALIFLLFSGSIYKFVFSILVFVVTAIVLFIILIKFIMRR